MAHAIKLYGSGTMRIGLIGSGNMARALAVGWARPLTCSALELDQAQALAALVGGTALATNAQVAASSDLVILCHKPRQLEEVALEIADQAEVVLSILAGVTLHDCNFVHWICMWECSCNECVACFVIGGNATLFFRHQT